VKKFLFYFVMKFSGLGEVKYYPEMEKKSASNRHTLQTVIMDNGEGPTTLCSILKQKHRVSWAAHEAA
jgi:hypothetical protein